MAFGYYKTATIDHTQCGSGGALASFPVTVWVTDADLKTVGNGGFVQNANGYDIRPYSDSALTTALSFELVFYDAVNGIVEMHINAGTGASQVNSTTDAVIYLAFGNTSLNTDGSSSATWVASMAVVQHYPNGSSLTLNDSTSNGVNGTNHGATATGGVIDGGIAMTGGQYASLGTPASLAFERTTAFSVQLWLYINNNGAYSLVGNLDTASNYKGWELELQSAVGAFNYLQFFLIDNYPTNAIAVSFGSTISTQVAPNTKYHYVVTYDGSSTAAGVKGYLNGVLLTNTVGLDVLSATTVSAAEVLMGIRKDGTIPLDGYEDELRVGSGLAWTVDYILASYNSQKPSSTFITWGAKVTVTSSGIPRQAMHLARMRNG